MEYNLENNQQESNIIREQKEHSNTLWYIVIAVLVLILVGWYGYSAGWFSPRTSIIVDEFIPTESENNIGDGTLPLNAAAIDSLRIETGESFPVQQVVVVSGSLASGCTYLNDPVQLRDGNVFYITLDTRTEGEICTEALVPYEERIDLQVNNLPAGVYIVNINGREISFELESNNALDFNAGGSK